ncbi:DegV family protein [Enterococcus nangangensis]|uniref:DegV family protein n=1 Tax=Enterococcus nangangensis TaxID=2559926 RepID=UPI0010F85A09|nr:DegV family protein [Enterococcus nangangensis]
MTYQLVTDSCCDLPYTWLKEQNIPFISMSVMLDGKEYFDDLGETFKPEWMVEQLHQGGMPTTSQINVGRYQEFFTPFVEKGIPLLYLCFSSGLSGSYQSALQAVALIKEDYPSADIIVFDTLNASLGEGLMVHYANALQKAGKSRAEVLAWCEENALRVHSFVKVDDLDHLKRGGRISKTAAVLGSLMNIKPMIIMDASGKLQNVGKVRGTNKALDQLAKDTVDNIENPEEQVLFIAHSDDLHNAEIVKKKIMDQIKVQDIIIYPLGATIASHTGIGCIAVFSIGNKRK